ncbi:MAG: tRNA (guanosine(37)-N1)-methyltransferase TrmD [Candidatus Pacebacteria bacterium]|nr:tRNA (guanosine(37)-N1)-methyltransferase TrmD [Candidatus Paceibacterota bacterium]
MKKIKQFNILTIYPDIFNSYFNAALIKTAVDKKVIKLNIFNLRDFANDNYKSVDDKPYGGGPGMIMRVDIIHKAIQRILKKGKTKSRIIVFSAKGKVLKQKDLERLKKYDNLTLVCGRFEGIDQRVIDKIADEEISIGEYVLGGGEIPAMTVVEGITRLLPNVLGNKNSLKEESYNNQDFVESNQYTRPEKFYPEIKNKRKV